MRALWPRILRMRALWPRIHKLPYNRQDPISKKKKTQQRIAGWIAVEQQNKEFGSEFCLAKQRKQTDLVSAHRSIQRPEQTGASKDWFRVCRFPKFDRIAVPLQLSNSIKVRLLHLQCLTYSFLSLINSWILSSKGRFRFVVKFGCKCDVGCAYFCNFCGGFEEIRYLFRWLAIFPFPISCSLFADFCNYCRKSKIRARIRLKSERSDLGS